MSERSLTMSLRSYANWIVSCAGGNVPPEAADAYEAADMIEGLLVALHDAIDRPKGVVPASADRFYDPQRFYPAPPAAMKDGGE